jgi:hypothetical protein
LDDSLLGAQHTINYHIIYLADGGLASHFCIFVIIGQADVVLQVRLGARIWTELPTLLIRDKSSGVGGFNLPVCLATPSGTAKMEIVTSRTQLVCGRIPK